MLFSSSEKAREMESSWVDLRFFGVVKSWYILELDWIWTLSVLCQQLVVSGRVLGAVVPGYRASSLLLVQFLEILSTKRKTEHKQSPNCNMTTTVDSMSENHGISSLDKKSCVILPAKPDIGERVRNECSSRWIAVPDESSDINDSIMLNEINMCQNFSQSLSLDAKVKHLGKSKTFPLKREMHTGKADTPGTTAQGQDHAATRASTYSRSISLPASSTLVSAMKGGRASNGTLMMPVLHVKWAPEVYDPPSTSMSHTVNCHQQRPKVKKKDKKHKHKGKASRANGGEKKYGNCKNSNKGSEPQNFRLCASVDTLVLDDFDKSNMVDIFGYDINDQEENCGSLLREALPKVHLSIGEAS